MKTLKYYYTRSLLAGFKLKDIPSGEAYNMPKVYNKHHKDAPKGSSYVGRPSKYGNPYSIELAGSREKAVELYANWLQHEIERGNITLEQIRKDLGGKDLVCWCAPKLCHADILIKLANDL